MRNWALLLATALLATLYPVVMAGAAPHRCFGHAATIVGTPDQDRIEGTPRSDVIVALGGDDFVDGRGGADLICLGHGGVLKHGDIERAEGGPGNDRIDGGRGVENLIGEEGADIIRGGPGREALIGREGSDTLFGGGRDDFLSGGGGDDHLFGGKGPDFLEGDLGDDVIDGGRNDDEGDTVSYASLSDDKTGTSGSSDRPVVVDLSTGVATGLGRDTLRGIEDLFGSGGDDTLIGDDGPNVIHADVGSDNIQGKDGDDCLLPSRGMDVVDGGAGFDYYSVNFEECSASTFGGSVAPSGGVTVDLSEGYASFNMEENEDTSTLVGIEGVFGSDNQDHLIGDDSTNRLVGNGGPDRLEGLGGDDYLDGGSSSGDFIDGGDGSDECIGEVVVSCE